MPSIKEIYHKIDDVRIEADTINLNVDGLEALAATQQADVAAIKADLADGIPVSVSSSTLPSGAATSANQTTANTSLSNIDTDIGAQADSAASTDTGSFSLISLFKRLLSTKLPDQSSGRIPVTLASAGTTGSTAPANANLIGGTDGTNLRGLSVDSSGRLNTNINGTVPVSGTVTANTGLTQPLTDTQLRASAVPVSGTFWQATQPVSGTVTQNVTPAMLTSYTQAGVIASNTILMTLDNSIYQSISIQCTSMGTTGTIVPEWSNDNSTWLSATILSRDGASTATSFTATGMWTTPAIARYFRLRLSVATTGGTTTLSVHQFNDTRQVWLATQPVTGTVGVSGVPSSSNGTSTFHTAISAASTNVTSVKVNNANIGSLNLVNTTASLRYFKLFNSSSAPTIGTSTPVLNYAIPPNSSMFVDCGWAGIRLSSGLAYAITAGQALLDSTAVGAGDVVVNIAYA